MATTTTTTISTTTATPPPWPGGSVVGAGAAGGHARSAGVTLSALCEPLFLYVCRLNRAARQNAPRQMQTVRNDVKGVFAEMRARAASQPHLAAQLERVRLPLVFFVDSTIRTSTLPFAMDWQDLAADEGELAGDEKFFVLLSEALAEKGEEADERVNVFLTCLGLGFTGYLTGQEAELKQMVMECTARLRGRVLADHRSRLCPEAYQSTDTSNLPRTVGSSIVGIAIAFVALLAVLVAANVYLYKWSSAGLQDALQRIEAADAGGAGGASAGPRE